MEDISISTPNIRLKSLEINNEGNISLPRIQIQITTFINYNIKEIFEEINRLNVNNYKIIKDNNKYKLRIEFEY